MALIDINDSSFREVYQNNDIVVLDFWAIWCGPCHQFSPIFAEVSEQYPDIVFGKVDTEQQLQLSSYFSIRSIPTIIIIREQMELFRHSGVLSALELAEVLEKVKNADMREVRKLIEQEDSENQ
ncbi:MAG: thioredoxin fold domain-containing protein [Bdellovibrionales bacterium]|nr:thioredoxin fold domain-containing protein [Bdellovibrionales bacterium]